MNDHIMMVPEGAFGVIWSVDRPAAIYLILIGNMSAENGEYVCNSVTSKQMAELVGLDPENSSDREKVFRALRDLLKSGLITRTVNGSGAKPATFRLNHASRWMRGDVR